MSGRRALARKIFSALVRPRSKTAFIRHLPLGARLLDVGCGNDSPASAKQLRPDLYYVGLDIGEYNQSAPSKAACDEYILCSPSAFAQNIAELARAGPFGAIVSAHNLEHCDDPDAVIAMMCAALRPEGRLYLAFPAEATVSLPSRAGTLNFYDDPTHRVPPPWQLVLHALARNGLVIDYARQRDRPLLLATIGALMEPWSRLANRTAPFGATWALYGFESVIWGRKRS